MCVCVCKEGREGRGRERRACTQPQCTFGYVVIGPRRSVAALTDSVIQLQWRRRADGCYCVNLGLKAEVQ